MATVEPHDDRELPRSQRRSDDTLTITDPHKAVAIDVAALKANPMLPGGFSVSGLVYDVAAGTIETVVPPALLRPDEA